MPTRSTRRHTRTGAACVELVAHRFTPGFNAVGQAAAKASRRRCRPCCYVADRTDVVFQRPQFKVRARRVAARAVVRRKAMPAVSRGVVSVRCILVEIGAQ